MPLSVAVPLALSVPVHMAVAATAMTAAAMAFAVVMVVAVYRRIISQFSRDKIIHRRIGIALYAAVYGNISLGEGILRACSYAAANQSVYLLCFQQGGQCAMPRAIAVQDVGFFDGVIFHRIYLELLGMSKMLKNLAVFIGNCNFHCGYTSFLQGKSR